MPNHSFNTLMLRLSRAGFKRRFVNTVLMPDWWEESYAKDPTILPEVEIRIARFLNIPLSLVRNVDVELTLPPYRQAQLRRVSDLDRNRLWPAIHTAIRVAEAVARNMRFTGSPAARFPDDALEWRRVLVSSGTKPVQLCDVADDLWSRGVPVIPLDNLPTPSFQGLACIVDGQPVIVLGQNYDEPGRVTFLMAHEAGHIAAGDCLPGILVLDQDGAIQDDSAMEYKAELFARRLLMGEETAAIPEHERFDAKALAQRAVDLESQTGVDAGLLIFDWAAKTLNYADASLAVKALYRAVGARRKLRKIFDEYVEYDSASESDLALLRCVYGTPHHSTFAG